MGKEFLNRLLCLEYEKELDSKVYFKVLHEFDVSGRGGYNTTEFMK